MGFSFNHETQRFIVNSIRWLNKLETRSVDKNDNIWSNHLDNECFYTIGFLHRLLKPSTIYSSITDSYSKIKIKYHPKFAFFTFFILGLT